MVIAVQEGPKRVSNDKSSLLSEDYRVRCCKSSYLCRMSSFQTKDLEPGRVAVLFHVDEQTQYNQPTNCLAIKNKACGDCERDRMRATQSVGRRSALGYSLEQARPPADSPEVSELENFEAVAAFLISHSSILSYPLLSYIAWLGSCP